MEAKDKIQGEVFETYDAFTRLILAFLMYKHTIIAKGPRKKKHRKKTVSTDATTHVAHEFILLLLPVAVCF